MGGRHRRLFEQSGVCFVSLADTADEAASLFDKLESGLLQVDFVVVATPGSTHFGYVQRLLELGIPTLCEKPVAVTAAEAEILRDLSLAKRVPLFIGHSERYNPAVEAFVQGDFFREMQPPFKFRFERTHGYSERNHDVSVELDLMVHDFDLLYYFIGNPRLKNLSVQEYAVDRVVATYEFEGALAEFTVDRRCARDCRQVEIQAGLRSAKLDLASYRNENPAHALQGEHKAFLHCLGEYRSSGKMAALSWGENLAGACRAVALASLIETYTAGQRNEG